MAHPLKNHSKISKTALWPQNFLRLRRAERGFAFGTVLVSPKSATLTVTIIPVSPEGGSLPRVRTATHGRRTHREPVGLIS